MKSACFLAVLSVLLAAAPVDRAGAQVPFTSTSPPNSNPFGNQGSGFGPMRSSSPAGGQQQAPPAGQYSYAAAAPAYATGPIDPDHHLGRGDHLSYRVQEDRDDKIWPLTVNDSGEVYVPLLGLVKAVGKSTSQLTSDIKAALDREYYYNATVVMGLDSVAPEASRGRVYVTGAVRTRGVLDLPNTPLTVSQAIVQAGGLTDFGDGKHVKVIRKNSPKNGIIVNVKAVQEGQTDKDVALQPDDTIVVPEKTFNISF